jgi:hypothetical protein
MTIAETVASVQNAPGSMYTREDVISLLNRIEMPSAPGSLDEKQIRELINKVVKTIEDNGSNLDSDCIDTGSAEFSLNYNEVCLDSVDFDTDAITSTLTDGLADAIEEFFEELKKEDDVVELERG